jgi:hypothetical protein
MAALSKAWNEKYESRMIGVGLPRYAAALRVNPL